MEVLVGEVFLETSVSLVRSNVVSAFKGSHLEHSVMNSLLSTSDLAARDVRALVNSELICAISNIEDWLSSTMPLKNLELLIQSRSHATKFISIAKESTASVSPSLRLAAEQVKIAANYCLDYCQTNGNANEAKKAAQESLRKLYGDEILMRYISSILRSRGSVQKLLTNGVMRLGEALASGPVMLSLFMEDAGGQGVDAGAPLSENSEGREGNRGAKLSPGTQFLASLAVLNDMVFLLEPHHRNVQHPTLPDARLEHELTYKFCRGRLPYQVHLGALLSCSPLPCTVEGCCGGGLAIPDFPENLRHLVDENNYRCVHCCATVTSWTSSSSSSAATKAAASALPSSSGSTPFSSSSSFVFVSAGSDNAMRVWDMRLVDAFEVGSVDSNSYCRLSGRPEMYSSGWITAVESAGAAMIVSGDVYGTLRLWRVKSGDDESHTQQNALVHLHEVPAAHQGGINDLSVIPSDNGSFIFVVSASSDQTARFWRFSINIDGGETTGELLASIQRKNPIRAIAAWEDQRNCFHAAIGSGNRLEILNLTACLQKVSGGGGSGGKEEEEGGEVEEEEEEEDEDDDDDDDDDDEKLPPPPRDAQPMQRCNGRSDNTSTFCVDDVLVGGHKTSITCIAVATAPHRTIAECHLAISGARDDSKVYIWNVYAGEPLKEKPIEKNGQLVPTAGQFQHRRTPIKALEGHSGSVYCCCIFRSDTRAATGASDSTISIWELEKDHDDLIESKTDNSPVFEFRRLFVLTGHRSDVTCITLIATDTRLIAGGRDGTIKMWHLPNRAVHTCVSNAMNSQQSGWRRSRGRSKSPVRRKGTMVQARQGRTGHSRSKSPTPQTDRNRSKSRTPKTQAHSKTSTKSSSMHESSPSKCVESSRDSRQEYGLGHVGISDSDSSVNRLDNGNQNEEGIPNVCDGIVIEAEETPAAIPRTIEIENDEREDDTIEYFSADDFSFDDDTCNNDVRVNELLPAPPQPPVSNLQPLRVWKRRSIFDNQDSVLI